MRNEAFWRETYTAPLSRLDRAVLTALAYNTITAANMNWLVAGGDGDLKRSRIFVSKLRKKLQGTGWTVSTNLGGGKPAVYKLVRG